MLKNVKLYFFLYVCIVIYITKIAVATNNKLFLKLNTHTNERNFTPFILRASRLKLL